MPWCDPCERFYNPNTLSAEQLCPDGHEVVHDEPAPGVPVRISRYEAAKEAGVPWHFWLLVGALILYLGWRAIEGVLWVVNRLL